jgi:aerobic-type carbon monoxide dehydrogenase small subunit (CoxS/CutS family)
MTDSSNYVCPYCSTSFRTHDDVKAHVVAEHGTEPLPKPHGFVTMTINGQRYEHHVEANTTLYHLIHDQMGLTGAKMFCDRGACGSCTVIMNGRPILSCMTLAIECDGKNIETIEGVAEAEHPLIESYVKHHAMQCGYCTPGFVVTAKALLDRNPDPTEDEIREAIAGNLCRCGTYPQHPKAIAEAAKVLQGGTP